MEAGRDAELSLLRARVRERVQCSEKLTAGVRSRRRTQQDRAHTTFMHAEDQLSHAAHGLPAVYGLASASGDRADGDVVDLVLAAARSVYHGCGSISVTAVDQMGSVDRRHYRTVAATGAAATLDAAQYTLGEGPSVDAVELDHVATVRVDDFAEEGATGCWSRFSAVATAMGVRSMVSVSLPWSRFLHVGAMQTVVGAINLYAAEAHAFPEPEAHGLVLGAWSGSVLTGRTPAEVYDAVIWRPDEPPAHW